MIKTVADLLTELVKAEERVLAKHRITHGPTIGRMYEGLTRKVVTSAIPDDLPMAVVTGFVEGSDGARSDEQDVMVVIGTGEQVPNTDSFIYPVDQVLCCIEVKKTLNKAQLVEGIKNLGTLRELPPHRPMAIMDSIVNGFQLITGRLAPDRADLPKVPPLYEQIYRHVSCRRVMPCRVLLGYSGYKTEGGLRAGIRDHISSFVQSGAPFGPLYLPDAILTLHASVAVNIASPWVATVEDGEWWPLLMSNTSLSPIEVLLEVIWTRLLQRGLTTAHVFGEDLAIEPWHRFIDAQHVTTPRPGWQYREYPFSNKVAKAADASGPAEWQPAIVSKDAFILAHLLARREQIDLTTLDWPQDILSQAVTELESHRIVGRSLLNEKVIGLLTTRLVCIVTPKGDNVVGDNVSGRVVRWLRNKGLLPAEDNMVKALTIRKENGCLSGEALVLPGDGIGWSAILDDVFSAGVDHDSPAQEQSCPPPSPPPQRGQNE